MPEGSKVVQVGSRLGPYQLTAELGAGGAGTVFVGEHTETHEKVALKVLRPGAELIEDIHSRFIREITVAQKLNDPHIVSYRDCDVEDGVLYYAMEFVPWGSMSDVLKRRGALPWREACECAIQMASALEHLHSVGVVHRDLKPANVFLSDDGRLKLGDFGLARDSDSPRLTVAGMTVGTCKYLAPEQAKGESEIDDRTDLYALGCNLFEMIIGRTPFESPDAYAPVTAMEMMRRHIEDAPPKLSNLNPHCPPRLSELVSALLAKDPDNRPSSAAAVVKELRQILNGSTEVARSAETAEGHEEEQSLTARLREASTGNREVSTGKLLGVLAVIVVLVALAALASSSK
jgi:serine/threonine-protein kinase